MSTDTDDSEIVTSSPLDYDDPPRVLSMPDLSGPNLSGDLVADAFEFVLRTRLPGFLAAAGLPEPTTYRQQPALSAMQDPDPPLVAIVNTGLAREPESSRGAPGQRAWTLTWALTVGYWLRGESWQGTTTAGQRYGACVRAAVLASPEGLAGRWTLTNEFYSDAEDTSARTLAAGYVEFEARVENAFVPAAIGAMPAPPIQTVIETVTPTPIPTGE